MLLRKLIIIIYLTTSAFVVLAQSSSKVLQKADAQYEALAYAKAIELYETALKKPKGLTDEETINSKIQLALAYRQVKDFVNAERVFRDVLSGNPTLKGENIKAYRHFAQVLTSNGKYNEANQYWQKFTELQEQDKRGVEFIKLNSNREALERNAGSYKVEYIGINSSSADFSPVYYKKGLVFVSGRSTNSGIKRVFNWDASSFLDLFYLEDLKVLKTETGAAAIGTSQSTPQKSATPSSKLGNDYYTPPTSNDSKTVGRKGSEYITGSKDLDYEEEPSIQTKKFSKALNSKYHEGPCTFFHDGSKIIFTRNGQSTGGGGIFGQSKNTAVNRLKLYSAEYEENEWRKIKELPFNSNDYSCGHPTISIDDKIMYFVSDMPGGYGGTDIWLTRYSNGSWSKPQNLGGTVNTRGSEMFPFVDERGNLYFSSDGHPGLGDLDIFFMPMNTATGMPSGKIRNLGAPLNSNRDDFGIITDSERLTGYLSSNRKRGGSDDDIYRFTRLGTIYGCREVVVNIYDNESKKPFDRVRFEYEVKGQTASRESAITNNLGTIKLCLEADNDFNFIVKQNGYQPASIDFSNKESSDYEASKLDVYLKKEIVVVDKGKKKTNETANATPDEMVIIKRKGSSSSTIFRGVVTAGKDSTPIAGVLIRFINQCTNEVQKMTTGADGSYEFKRDLKCDYILEASKENFGKSSELVPKVEEKRSIVNIFKKKTTKPNTGSLFDTKLYRVGDVVKLDNIYYDSQSYKIRGDAIRELEKLVTTMQKNPNMIIEIRSHTDTRGNAQDNLALSQRRANEVVDFLAKSGVARARIKGVGKGEMEPVNECGDGVQCTEAEHQRNRRTEFKILSVERK